MNKAMASKRQKSRLDALHFHFLLSYQTFSDVLNVSDSVDVAE